MARTIGLLYGLLAYALGLGSILYLIAFLDDVLVPKTLESGPAPSTAVALAVNTALLLLFAVQHSVMARGGFKRRVTRVLPASIERSTYVLASGLALAVLYAAWQPMPGVVWSVEPTALRLLLWVLQGLGWTVLVLATFMIGHFELFGLQQVWASLRHRALPASHFRMPGLYRVVRHPIQLGVLLGIWITPDMTVGRLVFCLGMSAYIVFALVRLEEPDLVREFGDTYRAYRRRVGMLFPRLGGGSERADASVR